MQIRLLDHGELDALVALHLTIVTTLSDRSFLYHRETDFFAELLQGDGAILGTFTDDGQLVAYGALVAPGVDYAAGPTDFGGLAVERALVAFAAGSGVHPDYRRRGLIRQINAGRVRIAGELGARYIAGVVAPANLASLVMLHGLGFAICSIYHDEDGENFVVIVPTAGQFPPAAGARAVVEAGDGPANLAVLREERLVGLPIAGPAFAYVDPESVLVSEA